MRQEAILVPMLAFTALVFLMWLRLGNVRISGGRRGIISPEYMRLGRGPEPPEYVAVIHHHFSNLLEFPVLFYAACITLFAARVIDTAALVLAWSFVVARCVHTDHRTGHQ